VQEFYQLMNNREYREYIRMNPSWYKEFNRTQNAHIQFIQSFEKDKRDSKPSRLSTIDKHINTANMVLKLIQGFK